MGCGEKTTNQQETKQTMTPEEQANQKLDLQRKQANAPMQQQMDSNTYNLINTLLTGGKLPGDLQGAMGISQDQNQSMVNQSIRSVLPQFQSAGLMDSGIAFQGATRAAQDTSNANAQFNVGAMQNLLNVGTGSSSNLTGAYNQSNSIMNNQLAGLRTINTSGSTIGMNPFLKSFETSMGEAPAKILESWASRPGSGGVGSGCWVASEIFGGWYHPKTVAARHYINFISPKWFKEFYIKYGERIAKFISNKPILKIMLRPLFEFFVFIAGREVSYAR